MTDTEPTVDPLLALQNENAERIQSCMRRGIRLDPIVQLKIRLDLLTEFAVAGPVRAQYEYAYESMMAQYLDSALESSGSQLVVPSQTLS